MGSMLSIVIPSYNEDKIIKKTICAIHEVLRKESINHELIFVDDGSFDNSWTIIENSSTKHSWVRGIRFSRNFGKEAAIMAGLAQAKGECCCIIDCDLQHPPQKIVEMYRLWQNGYEVIEARKSDRGKENLFYKLFANIFYKIISNITKIDMSNASDFKLLDRKAITALLNMSERKPFFRALSSWIGFKVAYVEFEVQEREEGQSKWSITSLIKYAINNVASFSTIPMQIVTLLGVIMLIVSAIFGGITFIQKLIGESVEGFTTMIIIQLFIGSIVMISLGIIGYYIARIYDEIKERPIYIVTDTCGDKDEN